MQLKSVEWGAPRMAQIPISEGSSRFKIEHTGLKTWWAQLDSN